MPARLATLRPFTCTGDLSREGLLLSELLEQWEELAARGIAELGRDEVGRYGADARTGVARLTDELQIDGVRPRPLFPASGAPAMSSTLRSGRRRRRRRSRSG
ncbi:hypothetical protein [Kribbella sp. VKM Ac-2571]|uniref:hypothetical protein n=1 Tax=Kribbella sp. VKM Ac-2571 TaxID=2512222 RepID=UPI00106180B4|nr:hypothetical protein [Kribbella sp. VKM Ac-2571]